MSEDGFLFTDNVRPKRFSAHEFVYVWPDDPSARRRGCADRMQPVLLRALDLFRLWLEGPYTDPRLTIPPNGAWTPGFGHAPNSDHYDGRAVDVHPTGIDPATLFLEASRFAAFSALGVYPWGVHLAVTLHDPARPRRVWARLDNDYLGVTPEILSTIALAWRGRTNEGNGS